MSYKRILKSITQEARDTVLDMRDGEPITIVEILTADNPATMMKPIFEKSACAIPSGLYQKVQRVLEIGGATPTATGIHLLASRASHEDVTENQDTHHTDKSDSDTTSVPRIPRQSTFDGKVPASKIPAAKVLSMPGKIAKNKPTTKKPSISTRTPKHHASKPDIEAMAREAERRVRAQDKDTRPERPSRRSSPTGRHKTTTQRTLRKKRPSDLEEAIKRSLQDKPEKVRHLNSGSSGSDSADDDSAPLSTDDHSLASSDGSSRRPRRHRGRHRRTTRTKRRRHHSSTSDTSSTFSTSDSSSEDNSRGRNHRKHRSRRNSRSRHQRSDASTDDSSHGDRRRHRSHNGTHSSKSRQQSVSQKITPPYTHSNALCRHIYRTARPHSPFTAMSPTKCRPLPPAVPLISR